MSLPILQIKRRNANPTTDDWAAGGRQNGLIAGELGFNYYNNSLWIGPEGSKDGRAYSILINRDRQITSATWASGTTFGPKLKFVEYDQEGYLREFQSATIPVADYDQSGVVNVGEQIFTGPKVFTGNGETIELPIVGETEFSVGIDKAFLVGHLDELTGDELSALSVGMPEGFGTIGVNENSFIGMDISMMSSRPVVDGRAGFMTTGVYYSLLGPRDKATSASQIAAWISDSSLDGSYLGYISASDLVAAGISTGDGLEQEGNTIRHSNSIAAGTVSGSPATGLKFGGSISIPSITYNTSGHITAASTSTVALPAITAASANTATAAKLVTGIELSNSGKLTTTTFNGNVGAANTFVYFNEGVPTAAAETIGSTSEPVYVAGGVISKASKYAGGTRITKFNGSNTASEAIASMYAPTDAGTEDMQVLVWSSESGKPIWKTQKDLDSLLDSVVFGGENDDGRTLTITVGGQTKSGQIPSEIGGFTTITSNSFVGELTGPVYGNADTATTAGSFTSAAKVKLTGDITGEQSSTHGWEIATTLANSGVTEGTYGPTADNAPGFGGKYKVPKITVDAKGRVTSAATFEIELPKCATSTSENTTVAKLITGVALSEGGSLSVTKYKGTLGTTTKPVYIKDGAPAECSVYAGGTKVHLNNADKGATVAEIYAPTTGGTKGYLLKSNGSTSEPVWVEDINWFTIGKALKAGDSLGDLKTPGKYYCNATDLSQQILDIPTGLNDNFVIYVLARTSSNSSSLTQMLITMSGTLYIRGCASNGAWKTWSEKVSRTKAEEYTDNAVATLKEEILGGVSAEYDTLSELLAFIDSNLDAITLLQNAIITKADKETTISLGDDLKFSAGDGKLGANMTITHSNSVTAKTTATQATATPGYGGSFTITEPKYDIFGHITGVLQSTITMPQLGNVTDDDIVLLSVSKSTDGNSLNFSASHEQMYGAPDGINNKHKIEYTSGNSTTSISGYGTSSTIKIPQISVDNYGHVMSAGDESITITIPNLGNNSTAPTAGGIIYAASTSQYASTVAGSTGQVLLSGGTGTPTWHTPTSINTANAIVIRDASGNFSAGTITAALSGNASSADKVNNSLKINNKTFDGSSEIDVGTIGVGYGGTGTTTAPAAGGIIYGASTSAYGCIIAGSSGQVLMSGGTGAPTWHTPASVNTKSAIVQRDANGNFSAGTITATLSGNASSANKVNKSLKINNKTFDGSSEINVGVIGVGYGGTGTSTAPTAGGFIYAASKTAYGCTTAGSTGQVLMSGGTSAPSWHTPTNTNTKNAIVQRDANGDFSARVITASLSGNASSADKVNQTLSINNKTFDGSSQVDVGTIGVGYGGTGTATAPKQGGIIYGASTSAYGCISAGNAGQYLISQGTSAPKWTNRIIIEVNPSSAPTEIGAIWITT